MTEDEWLNAKSVGPLRDWCEDHRRRARRKQRLFACACCRRLWDHLTDPRSRAAVEAAEAFADGKIDKKALNRARASATSAARAAPAPPINAGMAWRPEDAAHVLANAGWEDAFIASTGRASYAAANLGLRSREEEGAEQAKLLRDIFGNPFRPGTFQPTWRSDTVLSLAWGMYEARDFSAMPILADALQDAGCADEDVLAHCRGGGPHVRGCWVVDLVLGKE
jgi:hypothetical protein